MPLSAAISGTNILFLLDFQQKVRFLSALGEIYTATNQLSLFKEQRSKLNLFIQRDSTHIILHKMGNRFYDIPQPYLFN